MLIYEKSFVGKNQFSLPATNVETITFSQPRQDSLELAEVAEFEVVRHYTGLAKKTYSIDEGFYPLGSCTMKYNPKLHEDVASLAGFTEIHPLQPVHTVPGAMKVFELASTYLCEITGMEAMSFQPAAGAHGEWTALLMIKKYHQSRGDLERLEVIVPDSAHGTNPASANMCGFKVVEVKSHNGLVDVEELKKLASEKTAALMLTNPNTLGLFEKDIIEIAEIIHGVGGLLYYDGANLNAIMGHVRPGDMGFDAIHLNLHKTFSTPHGGGGPGSGPVAVNKLLEPFMPTPMVKDLAFFTPEQSIGRVKAFHGHFLVFLRALTYIKSLGKEGIRETSENAVLNANYLRVLLSDIFEADRLCMHEFVVSLDKLKKETGVSALDFSKAMLDHRVHPPTMYFPLVVAEALMFEPTETETKETLDWFSEVLHDLYKKAYEDPEYLKTAPHQTIIGRVNEVEAARKPLLRYQKEAVEEL